MMARFLFFLWFLMLIVQREYCKQEKKKQEKIYAYIVTI